MVRISVQMNDELPQLCVNSCHHPSRILKDLRDGNFLPKSRCCSQTKIADVQLEAPLSLHLFEGVSQTNGLVQRSVSESIHLFYKSVIFSLLGILLLYLHICMHTDIHTGSVLNPHSSRSSQEEEEQTKNAGVAQRKPIPEQGQTSGGAACGGTIQDPPVSNLNVEGTVSKAGLEERVMLLARELDLPLSMYVCPSLATLLEFFLKYLCWYHEFRSGVTTS